MTRRMFHNDPPRITFKKDFRMLVHGDLLPGKTVAILYDADRLPHERSTQAWTIQAFYKFRGNGEVHSTQLWSETGTVRTKLTNETGEGTMMTCRIELPADADHLEIWFLNTGASQAQHWDSNFGKNYVFRFVAEDLEVERAEVARDPNAPLAWLRVTVLAGPEVADLAVLYRLMNDPAANLEHDQRLALALSGSPEGGRCRWTGAAAVPETAVVRYTFHYLSNGNPHEDTNTGKGYLAWVGAHRNLAAGVL